MLGLTVREFDGFAPEDFDAFENRKWRSNRFNLERMRVHDKLALLGDDVLVRAPALAEGLTREVSGCTPTIFNNHEVDSLWLCFRRPDAEHRDILAALEQVRPLSETVRDPQPLHKEVLLAVRVTEEGLEVSLRLHAHAWVDAENLLVRCEDEAERSEWARLLGALAPLVGVEARIGDHVLTPGAPIDDAALAALRALAQGDAGWLLVRWLFARADERLAGAGCAALVAEHLTALLPLRRFVAWSEATDRLDLAGRLAERRAAAVARAAEAPPEPAPAPPKDAPARPFVPTAVDEEAPAPAQPQQPAPEPIRDEDRRPEWARFTPAPRPARPAQGPADGRRGPRPGGPPRDDRPRDDRPRDDRPFGDRPRDDRPRDDRPRDDRPRDDRPSGDRPRDDRPRDDRPSGDRPSGDRPSGARPASDRPSGDRPRGDRPSGDRPSGDRPRGDRPRGDRPSDGRRDDRRRDDRRRDDRGGGRDRAYTVGPDEGRRGPAPRELKPSGTPVEVRCQARVLNGLFSGQVGTVLEVDAKGNAQVLIHKRTVRVEVAHLQRME